MNRAFTLLEVMVAMAILALGLTIILSSQAGLLAATRRVQNETYAASLMRCKMSEVELDLLQNGYNLLEQTDSGECCEDEGEGSFRCEWSVQTVELPLPSSFDPAAESEDSEESEELEGADVEDAEQDLATSGSDSAFGEVAGIVGGTAFAGIDGVEGLGDVAGDLDESSEGGGIIGMALGMVYPTLKPMLEASIRKIVVKVLWTEGKKERTFEVVQYVTNPLEGNLSPNAAEDLDAALEGADGTSLGTEDAEK